MSKMNPDPEEVKLRDIPMVDTPGVQHNAPRGPQLHGIQSRVLENGLNESFKNYMQSRKWGRNKISRPEFFRIGRSVGSAKLAVILSHVSTDVPAPHSAAPRDVASIAPRGPRIPTHQTFNANGEAQPLPHARRDVDHYSPPRARQSAPSYQRPGLPPHYTSQVANYASHEPHSSYESRPEPYENASGSRVMPPPLSRRDDPQFFIADTPAPPDHTHNDVFSMPLHRSIEAPRQERPTPNSHGLNGTRVSSQYSIAVQVQAQPTQSSLSTAMAIRSASRPTSAAAAESVAAESTKSTKRAKPDPESSPEPPKKKSKKSKKEKAKEKENEAEMNKKTAKKPKRSAEEAKAELGEKFRVKQEIEKAEIQARIQAEIEERVREALKAKQDEDARKLRTLCLDSALDLRHAIPKLESIIYEPSEPGPVYELATDGEKLYNAVAMLGKFEERMRHVVVHLANTVKYMKKVDGLEELTERQQELAREGFKVLDDAEALKENLEELFCLTGEVDANTEEEMDKRKERQMAKARFQKDIAAIEEEA